MCLWLVERRVFAQAIRRNGEPSLEASFPDVAFERIAAGGGGPAPTISYQVDAFFMITENAADAIP
jgi:hypothetical protein